MDCPVCKTAMVVLELDEVEIDYCPTCAGIWLDAGELELLLGAKEQAASLWDSFRRCSDSGEVLRRCPLCRRKMEKIRTGADASAPLIDKCPRNEGLWFDAGELAEVVKCSGLDPQHKIVNFLRDMFYSQGE